MQCRLTVYFDGQFWVGIFERQEGEFLQAAKMVFGPEPSSEEVYEWIQRNYLKVRYGAASKDVNHENRPMNPKRMQRMIQREMQQTGVGTKAQQALQCAREEMVKARKLRQSLNRKAEEERRFMMKQEKKKQKKRGH